jgi:hemerythrin-like metal-binding protein
MPNLANHQKEHQDFVNFVVETIKKFKSEGANLAMLITVHQQLGDWLVNHILKLDKEIAKYK